MIRILPQPKEQKKIDQLKPFLMNYDKPIAIELGSQSVKIGRWSSSSTNQESKIEILKDKRGLSQIPICLQWPSNELNQKRFIGKHAIVNRMKAIPQTLINLARLLDLSDCMQQERNFLYDDSQIDLDSNQGCIRIDE